jgi:Icc-related predicted phosphoesterase
MIHLTPATSRKERSPESLLITCISDTHLLHRDVVVPDGHILIHAGDICHMGRSKADLADFNAWLGELPHTLKVVCPGNHDLPLEEDASNRRILTNAVLLINEGVEFDGLRLWGSPVIPPIGGAFCVSRPEDRRRIFSRIPDDTDILITHGPAFGVLDSSPGSHFHAGDRELLIAVERIRPKLLVSGHIHPGHGVKITDQTVFVNAALLGENGGIGWEPIVLRMPRLR